MIILKFPNLNPKCNFLLAPTLHVGAYIVDWVDSYWLQYAFPRTAWERRNNAYQHGTDPCKEFDWDELAKSTALGAAGRYAGGLGGNLGKRIKDYSRTTPTITNIGYPSIRRDGPITNYGRAGAAAGAAIGAGISNGGGLW